MAVREKESPPPLTVGEVVDHHAGVLGDTAAKHTHPGRPGTMIMMLKMEAVRSELSSDFSAMLDTGGRGHFIHK